MLRKKNLTFYFGYYFLPLWEMELRYETDRWNGDTLQLYLEQTRFEAQRRYQ
jgi:hypothetical protein